MSRYFQHLHFQPEKIPGRCFFDEKIRFHGFDLEFEPEAAKKIAIGDHRRSEWVTTDWATKPPLDPGNVLDVIDMAVR